MDNLEFVPSLKAEGLDISGDTQLPSNNLLKNDILEDTSTSGSFQDPLLLASNQIAPLTLEDNFTGEISESEIAPIELNNLTADGTVDPLTGNSQLIAPLNATFQAAETGVFTVNATGEFTIDFLFDAGSYNSEFAVFSLAGMEGLTAGSSEYIKEAASRALTNSESGYIIIADDSEGAKLTGELGESDKNAGNYSGIKTFSMNPGDDFAFMLVPQGKVQDVFDNPEIEGDKRPLFSIASANPDNATQMMQLLDGTVDGGVFGIEDLRLDKDSDADYNDIIFHVKGAAGKATPLIDVVNSENPWYETPLAGELIDFAKTNNIFDEASEISIGLVNDTGSSQTDGITNNPSLSGSISNPQRVVSFKAGFNDLVDISDSLQSDGSFSLDKEKLEQINNDSLIDGEQNLTLQAQDSFGNVLNTEAFTFTLDTQAEAPTNLIVSGVDGSVTNDNTPTIIGEAETGSKVELFNGEQLVGETTVNSAWEITTVALADGVQSITAKVTDVAGNVSNASQALVFTVDTVAPQLNITTPVADSVLNKGARLTGKLDETGSGIVDLTYQFGDRTSVTVPVNENGEFDVELDLTGLSNGTQTLTITSTDLAGNTSSNEISVNVNLDVTAPVITASLATDSGSSDSDKITNNPAITGSVTDNSEITSFKAGFDDTATENFVDVLADLQPDGSFSFDAAKLREINGDVDLSEGEHTLKLIASDAVGNTNEVLEFTFTLDTQSPNLTINSPSVDGELTEGSRFTGSLDETGDEIASLTYQFSGGDEITVPVNDNGEFDVELDLTGLSNGNQTLTITSTDLAGNTSSNEISVNVNLDVTAPVITASLATDSGSSDSDKITNNPAITGSITDNSEITSFKAGFDDTATENFVDVLADLQPDGSFSFDSAKLREINGDVDLSEGENTLKLIATDAVGNTNEILEFTFTLDTQSPNLTINSPSVDGELSEGAKFTGSLDEAASAIASLSYQFSGGDEITVPVNDNGEFDVELDLTGLSNGNQTLTITSSDLAGNVSAQDISVNVTLGEEDTTAPVITASLATDSGSSDSDKITNNPAITGSITDNSEITSFSAGFDDTATENFVDVLADLQPDGSFSFDAAKLREINGDVDLSEGENILKLIASDAVGNTNEVLEFTFTLDTQLPNLTINSPSVDGELTEGAKLTGSLDETGDEIASLSYQFSGGDEITVPVNENGEFDVELDLTGLSNGNQTLTITTTDLAGNVTTQDISVNVTLGEEDTTAPVITASLATDSGSSDSDKITNNPAITGSVTDNSEITSFKAGFDDTATENFVDVLADLQPDGSFSFDAAKLREINGDADLSEGENTLKLIATDAVGNTNEVLEFTFTLDTQSPNLTINSPSVDGELTEGAKLTGSLNEAASAIASLSYQFSGGDEITVPVNDNGEFDVELDLTGLSNGSQTLTITSTDLAGNTSSNEISVNVNLDVTAPVITASLATDSGSSDSDKITNNPAITGSITDNSEITSFSAGFDDTATENFVDVLADLQPDGSFSFDAAKLREINGDVDLSEGENTLKLIASDAVGNTNEVLEFTFTLDTQSPNLTINSPSVDGELSEGAKFTGSLNEAASAIASLSYQFSGGDEITVPVNENGEFDVELDLTGLSNGNQTLTITTTDLAGNVTTQDISVNVTLGEEDTTAPVITASLATDSGSSDSDKITNNPAITGSVTDNSEITSFKAGFDDTATENFVDVLADLQPDGSFSFDAAKLREINGDADLSEGENTLKLIATDAVGNVSEVLNFSFTLDNKLPTLSIESPAVDAQIAPGDKLVGTVDENLASLTYRFDNLSKKIVSVTDGAFAPEFDLTGIGDGAHTLTITAKDLAGNVKIETLNVVVNSGELLRVTGFTPLDGATETGVTFRPQVFFSEAVDTSTLNQDNFFATASGEKIAANIIPADDGSFAWLFFEDAMPSASVVEVTVDGSTIKPLDGADALDADGDGEAGGVLNFDFSTVSLAPLPNTSLSGIIADPGPDLLPFTADDFEAGADGIKHTEDDVFLLPIEGVEVFLIGLEDQKVFTDANGRYVLDSVPGGNAKLVMNGMTATATPEGFYFPEMVTDTNLEAGVDNFAMPGMPEMYLPRIANEILKDVDVNETTKIVADEISAPGLNTEEREFLSIEVQPNSLVSASGERLDSGQVGISTVPPELVRDMLPPGVLQHTFDITVQAPGITNFSTPAPMTFPNVFDAEPGSQLNFLSFDHTTGRLVIEGTATVSEDGKSVTTDPDTGITHPGWHGLTPPGGCGGSGGAPPQPPEPSDDEKETKHDPVALNFITGEAATNFSTLTWNAPSENPNSPSLPPIPGCNVPRHNPDDDNQQPFINVTIEIDGPLKDFMKPVSGGLPLDSQGFTLSPGTGDTKKFGFETKTYDEVFGAGGFTNLMRDQLYGSQIKITVVEQKTDGTRTRDIYTYYQNRWVDVIDAEQAKNKTGNTAAFHRTIADGSGNFVREKNVDYFLPSNVNTSFNGSATEFNLGNAISSNGKAAWKFDPTNSGNKSGDFKIQVNDPKINNLEVGEIKAKGTATNSSDVSINTSGFKSHFKDVIQGLKQAFVPGADGKPGIAGTDDDGNGTIDDITEYGAMGSDDSEQIVYDIFNSPSSPAAVQGSSIATAMLAGSMKNVVIPTANNFINLINNGLFIASNRFTTEFANFLPGQMFTDAQLDAKATELANDLLTEVKKDFQAVSSGIKIVESNLLSDVTVTWQDTFSSNSPTYGGADRYDYDTAAMRAVIGTPGRTDPITGNTFNLEIPDAAQQWALADLINDRVSNSADFGLGINISWTDAGTSWAQFLANTVSHELAHTFGLNEAYISPVPANAPGTARCNAQGNCFPYDIMRLGINSDPDLNFAVGNLDLLKASVGIQPNADKPISQGLKLWRDNFNLRSGLENVNGIRESLPEAIIVTPEIKLSRDSSEFFGFGDETDTYGSIASDGIGNQNLTVTYEVTNFGTSPLVIDSISLKNGNKGFSVINDESVIGVTLAPNESTTISVIFDPTVIDDIEDTLIIQSNADTIPLFEINLNGQGISATPSAQLSLANNNNLGGIKVAGETSQATEIATITNNGASTLTISDIKLVEGNDTFTLTNIPTDLATNPINLEFGETFTFGDITFNPNIVGLDRALIEVVTNDPNNSIQRFSVVGTGLDEIVYPEWGNDYIAIETPELPGSTILRTVSDDEGNFELFLPPEQSYHMTVFDPETGLVSHSYGTTPESGQGINLTSSLVFNGSTAPDTDFDGLPDDIELAIGTSSEKADTDDDGILDFTEIEQGLDPLGGRAFPTGIIASLELEGEAKEVVVKGSNQNANDQTAYIATGSHGLAIVNASQFNNPIVLGQLNLPGDATDVAVDTNLNIAAVATNTGGLQLVDVSDTMLPKLLQTLNISANQVEVLDGIVYAAVGSTLHAIDLLTGEELQTLSLGSGNVTGMAREGSILYTMSSNQILKAVDISSVSMAERGSLTLPDGGGKLFVGNGIAYAAAASNFRGGFATANISDPDNITLVSGSDVDDTSTSPGTAIAVNGSGLGLLVGRPGGTQANVLNLMDISDPSETNLFLNRIDLPTAPESVAIASGIAFVADGSSGLQVINYLGFDNQGQAPTVTISSPEADLDADVEGIQVLEGSSLPIQVDVEDDVQVRNVELLVNGEVVSNDVSFPFDLTATALNDDLEATTVDVQVRATDTGGNSTISNNLTFNLVPDTFAPNVTSTSPKADGRRKNISGISVRFDEPIDTELVDLSGITLTNLGADEAVGGDDDTTVTLSGFQTSETGRSLFILPPPDLTPGKYQLKIDPSIIADRAGNALTEEFTLDFTKRPPVTSLTLGETITGSIFEAGEDEVYTFEGTAGQRLYFDGILGSFNLDARLVSPSGEELFRFQNVNSDRVPFNLIETGTYQLIIDGSGDTTGDFSFRLSDLDQATDLTLDTTINGTLEPATETDIFKFAGTKGQKLFFDNAENNFFNASWSIYGAGNQQVESRSFFSDFEFTLEADGNYIAVLQGFGSEDNEPINYSFQVVTPETVTTELTLGEQVSGNISEAGEEDIYTFSGTAGQSLYYDGISGESGINTRLISPSGQQVLFSSNTSSDRQPVTLAETGTYQLIVDGNGDITGDYNFQLLDTAEATDLTFDTTISGSLEPGRETVLYKFTGAENQRLFLEDKGSASGGTYTLYAPGNQQIISTSFTRDREIILPGNGTYILAVQGSSEEETLNYSFSLITSEITTTELTLGEIASSNISKSGEEDIYTFTGTAGQRLYYDGISGESGINTRLISPSGEQILFSNSTSSNRQPITLIETGSYQLVVDGSAGTTGDYSFQLLDLANATELTLDTTINGSLEPGQETVLYKFEGAQNQKLFLDDKGSQTGGTYRLYAPGNQQVVSTNFTSDRDITLPANGTYILAIEGFSNEETLNYRFSVVTSEITTTELTLGETVSSNISKSGEEDIYTFTGTVGQRLYYDGISGESGISTRFISPSGEQVFSFNNTASNREPLTLVETGTYQLIVDGNSGTTGDYSFQLLDLANATDLTLDTEISGSLEPGTESDIYKFTGEAGQNLSFEDKGNQSGGSYRLYSGANQLIASRNLRSNFNVTLPGDGTYFLVLEGASNDTVNYRFQVVKGTLDDPGEPVGTELTLGEIVTSNIGEAEEQDTYIFTGTAGQTLYYDGISGDSRIDTRLISPSGVQLFSFFTNTSSDRQPFTLVESGTYQLIVDGSGVTTGDYSFQLLDIASATDLTLDTTINGSLEPGQETVLYKFEGTANQKLFLEDKGSQGSGTYVLYAPGNQQVTSQSLRFDREITLPGNGVYILAVQGFSNEETLSYSFSLITSEITTTELTLGEIVSSNISKPGEEDIYTFSGTAGQRLYYDGISGNSTITRLISPSGVQLFNTNTVSNRQPVTLVESGTYQLIVDGSSNTTGDYSFQLLDIASARDLTLDTTINGSLEPGQETVLYKFEGTANQKLFLDDKGSQGSGTYGLYAPGNQQVTSQSLRFDREITLPGNGTYILAVQGFSNEETLSYSFSLVTSEITTTELTLGEIVSSNISKPGEEDIYTFTGTAGQTLYYDGISGNSQIDTRLISPSGEQIFSFFTNTASNREPLTLVETGTYQLIVDGNSGTTGDYSFQLLDTASATELTLDTTINGSLEPGQETVLYKFEGTANQKLFLEDKGSQGSGTYVLYAPGNQQVTSQSLRFDREITLPGNGVYILAVQGFSNEETLSYSFSLITSEITTTELTLGEIVSSNISKPGEEDIYTFSGTAGQRLYYDGISGNSTITRLISPSGVQLFNTNTVSDRQPVTLVESGTYQLIVDGSGNTTGVYSFQLLDLANATNIDFDTTISGSLDSGQQTILYKFEGTAEQQLSFEDLGSERFAGSYVLYGPGNQFITSRSLGFDFQVTLPGDGIYFLAVQTNSNEEVNYSFRVS